jgi:hypothetical protein
MGSSSHIHVDKLLSDPDSLTTEDFLKLTLSTLSKNLSHLLSDRWVILTYIRWLDTHRQNPSRVTEHWMNTSQQWVQALHARGFRQSELIGAIESWKEEHSYTKDSARMSDSRRLPTKEDIVRLFEIQKADGRPTDMNDRYGKTVGDFQKPPPGNYVCNRCGKKGTFTYPYFLLSQKWPRRCEVHHSAWANIKAGHHLQVCPTNLDPAYDKPPNNSYTCPICHLKGKHYRSLCPKNTDPYSLTQKRIAKGIKSERDLGMLSKWGADISRNDGHRARRVDLDSSRWSASPDYVPTCYREPHALEKFQQLEHEKLLLERRHYVGMAPVKRLNADANNVENQIRGRQGSSTPSRSSNEGSPTPDKKQSLRKRIRRIEGYEGKLASGKTLESTQIDLIRRKAVIQEQLNSLDQNDSGQMDLEYGDEIQMGHRLHRTSISSEESNLQFGDKMSISQPKTPTGITRLAKTSEFIQKLIQCRGEEMTEIVNDSKQRQTALDMWELDDRRRLLRMAMK